MATVKVVKLTDGSGFRFNARLLANDARKLDIALRKEGFEIDQGSEEAAITPEEMKQLNDFYGD